ncbi:MAG: uroporphyrinogen decarboxylase [Pseudomonadota bacterium]
MKPILNALSGHTLSTPPVWLMRQAGRYLPEYRQLRAQAGGFLDLVYNPSLACEITLQPIRRFHMDGAILFSDILVVPDVLNRNVTFTAGEGPKLTPLETPGDIAKLAMPGDTAKYDLVAETVQKIKDGLVQEGHTHTTLIGFAGAPWTIACYMIEGGGSRDFAAARRFARLHPTAFADMLQLITDTTFDYLCRQIQAGAEAVQLFDSWAGVLPADELERWVIVPACDLVRRLKACFPDCPVIGFPRGIGPHLADYASRTGVQGLGVDEQFSPAHMAALPQSVCVQGNLDPVLLLRGGPDMFDAAERLIQANAGRPFIFNLGHGVIKETDPETVASLVDFIRRRGTS